MIRSTWKGLMLEFLMSECNNKMFNNVKQDQSEPVQYIDNFTQI